MICGETPFYSDDLVTTYSKIMSHTTSLHLPKDIAITPSCLDFIKRTCLLCEVTSIITHISACMPSFIPQKWCQKGCRSFTITSASPRGLSPIPSELWPLCVCVCVTFCQTGKCFIACSKGKLLLLFAFFILLFSKKQEQLLFFMHKKHLCRHFSALNHFNKQNALMTAPP